MKILFIGDPHIKSDNVDEIDILMNEIKRLFVENSPNFIVVAGDVMHYHEKVYTPSLNKALEFIKFLTKLAYTYILVGNHDYENNNQFLTQNHWMNALKQWENVEIVDKVVSHDDFLLVPYVYPKRFVEALNTYEEKEEKADYWKTKKVIFAHQEFKGCKMGAIVSENGDDWDESYPQIISGHIHDRQWVGKNIYYPGAPLQHAFGDHEERVLCMAVYNERNNENDEKKDEKKEEKKDEKKDEKKKRKTKDKTNDKKEKVDEKNEERKEKNKESLEIVDFFINVPKKQIIKATGKDVSIISKKILKELKDKNDQKIKIKIEASMDEFKLFKETKEYKEIVEKGVKIQLVREKMKEKPKDKEVGNFISILEKMIDEDETMVRTVYDELIGMKEK